MMSKRSVVFLVAGYLLLGPLLVSCGPSKKRGCPANEANMGAERLLSGEKPAKKNKWKGPASTQY